MKLNLLFTIVIPTYNRADFIATTIQSVLNQTYRNFELLVIDDGSTDNSWQVIEQIIAENANFKAIKFQRNYGKSPALNEGFKAALGEVVITMDADMQDSPDEIPELRRMILEDGFDIVSGWKQKREGTG